MNMHLADSIEVFSRCRLWLAFFDGESGAATEQDLVAANFSSRDLSRWQQFRPAEKKRQFLNSRLAIRAVLRKEFGKSADGIMFRNDVHGCPLLQSSENRRVAHISLSHSANTVAVVISDGEYPVGVDVEVEVSEPLRTQGLNLVAMHRHEQAWCDQRSGDESRAATTIWTIKESVWKTLREIRDIPFSDISIFFDGGTPRPVILNAPPAISNPAGVASPFRTQLFVQNTVSIVSNTLKLAAADVALRGCVSQRVLF